MNFPFHPLYDAALTLLPERMHGIDARAMVLAICLQESQLEHRRQLGGGPARGFPQFEMSGIVGVLTHAATKPYIREVLKALRYDLTATTSYRAIEHNDVLAMAYARLNLWWLPDQLPSRHETDEGWRQYLAAWRPGKPHPTTWPGNFARAWDECDAIGRNTA